MKALHLVAPEPLIAGQSCPLCGGSGVPVGESQGHKLRECYCNGRILLSWPWESEAAYEQFYADNTYHTECQIMEGFKHVVDRDDEYLEAAESRLKQLDLFLPNKGRLLDVGSGAGSFVEMADKHGYHAMGLEPSGTMVKWCAERGRNIYQGGWQDVEGKWDVLTAHDVIEHLTRPEECLLYLHGCLDVGGMLVVELPEWGSPLAAKAGLAWRHVHPLQHIWLPDDKAIRALFDVCGFNVEATIRPRRGALAKVAYYLSAKDTQHG